MSVMNILLGVALAAVTSRAAPGIPSWTGRPTPAIFAKFKYALGLGFEVEVPGRALAMIADDFDLDALVAAADPPDLADFSHDYLNPRTWNEVGKIDPEFAARLSRGLELDAGLERARIESNATSAAMERLAKFRAAWPAPRAFEVATPRAPLHRPELVTAERTTLIEPPSFDLSQSRETHDPVRSDWPILNARWNREPWTERKRFVRARELSADRKAELVRQNAHRRAVDGGTILTGAGAAPYLRPFALQGHRHFTEVLHHAPVASPVVFLDHLRVLTGKTHLAGAIRAPQATSRRDSSYHFSVSVEGRTESLEPILRAWQTLVVIKHVEAGILNLFGGGTADYDRNLDGRGMVRSRGPNFVEIRDHFTDPETELAMFLSAVNLPNDQAVRLIYEEYMPVVSPAMMRAVYAQAPDAFVEIFFGAPEFVREVPALVTPEDARFVAWVFVSSSGWLPDLLSRPADVASFLGPAGTERLRAEIRATRWVAPGGHVIAARMKAFMAHFGETVEVEAPRPWAELRAEEEARAEARRQSLAWLTRRPGRRARVARWCQRLLAPLVARAKYRRGIL